MVLSKVTVPPGARLAVHHHLGTQISRVVSGTLTYTVREGKAELFEGEEEEARLIRDITAGKTARIRAGQWLVEQPSDIHQAANRGSSPVVIYLATLLKDGAAPSTPVDLHQPGAPR
jgi:quercetin dioxygenase-like cupin family protein